MSPKRSDEERERARLAREAKRAAREGRPPPQALPPIEIPPPPIETSPPPAAGPPEPPTEVVPPPQAMPDPRTPDPPSRFEPAPPPEPVEPEPEPVEPEPEPVEPWPEPEPVEPEPEPVEPEPVAEVDGPRNPAVDPGRPVLKLPSAQRAPAPPPGAPDRGAARRAKAQRVLERRRAQGGGLGRTRPRRRRLIPLAVAGVLTLAVAWFLFSLYQPFKGEGEGTVAVMIPSGSGVGTISDLLAERGVVSNAFFFRARATLSGRSGDFKAGRFSLREDMSYAAAIDALSQSPATQTVSITVPEGRARREVKGLVGDDLEGDYLALTKRSPLLDPSDYGAKGASDLEGFLFPATYELKRGQGTRELVKQQLRTFEREFAKVDMSFAKRKNLTRYDVLVIASMVEREAQVAKERPVIASVIYNRLSEGIPLGIDATIRFATNNWTRPLTESELGVDSPYNTRERQGLPPGPIGSPGLASLQAAAKPAKTGFLFYVVKPNTCGEHAFSETDAEFQANVDRYNQERAARGGESPTDC
ncbi:MAG: endolytic transglycosylase MltG [Actinomycetota bacterium]|nr:endolytic transglycosylase MltG [Actinomycetota bacterium]